MVVLLGARFYLAPHDRMMKTRIFSLWTTTTSITRPNLIGSCLQAALVRVSLLTLAVTFCGLVQSSPAQLSALTAEVRDFYSLASPVIYAATQGGGLQKSVDN